MSVPCNCIKCRMSRAILASAANVDGMVDPAEVLPALAAIAGALLAQVDDEIFNRFIDEVTGYAGSSKKHQKTEIVRIN